MDLLIRCQAPTSRGDSYITYTEVTSEAYECAREGVQASLRDGMEWRVDLEGYEVTGPISYRVAKVGPFGDFEEVERGEL